MKWEYMLFVSHDHLESREFVFNHLGEMGWELVTMVKTVAYFKRPVETVKILGIYDNEHN